MFEEEELITRQHTQVINVSSVPQRSPFRYAGGKTWLVPTIRKWLSSKEDKILIEPFCGGGTVSLTAVAEDLVSSAIMIEKDADVAAVWETIMRDSDWLVNRILNFKLSQESVIELLQKEPANTNERAFHTIVKNRVNHGGILAKGAGTVKFGENGKGIASRWYPQTLATRIKGIALNNSRFQFFHGDAFDFLTPDNYKESYCFFIDPPYTIAGRRLYTYYDIDHEELFKRVAAMPCHYMMTYDKCDYVQNLADTYGLKWREIPMQTTHLIKKYELIICDDFDWLDSSFSGMF